MRAFNALGVPSAYSNTWIADMAGRTAPPSDPTGFVVQSYGAQARFMWDKPAAATDLDVVLAGRAIDTTLPDYRDLDDLEGMPRRRVPAATALQ